MTASRPITRQLAVEQLAGIYCTVSLNLGQLALLGLDGIVRYCFALATNTLFQKVSILGVSQDETVVEPQIHSLDPARYGAYPGTVSTLFKQLSMWPIRCSARGGLYS